MDGLLSTGPSPSSFKTFFIKNMLILNIYLSWLVLVRFWSRKKQTDDNKMIETLILAKSAMSDKSACMQPWPLVHFYQKLDLVIYNFFLNNN